MIVLKLGGSVITDKSTPNTLDRSALERAAAAIGTTEESVVLVHGGGSFGHPAAARHGVSPTDGTHDPTAVTDIHRSMTDLTDAIVEACQDHGAPAVPVRTLSVAARDDDGALSVATDPVETMRLEGFLPVLSGDVIAHRGAGSTILSGDELTVGLARRLSADRVGLCSATPGVLDADGDPIDVLDADDPLPRAVGGSETTDVTGGMAAKIQSLQPLDAPARVFDLDGLGAFLGGGDPGTLIR